MCTTGNLLFQLRIHGEYVVLSLFSASLSLLLTNEKVRNRKSPCTYLQQVDILISKNQVLQMLYKHPYKNLMDKNNKIHKNLIPTKIINLTVTLT